MVIEDSAAEELEEKGLWRRAARRWLDVLDQTADVTAREAITRRRDYCLGLAVGNSPDCRRRSCKCNV